MKGFDASSYGEAFADVYDEWYGDVGDVEATVDMLTLLGDSGPFLELGVGTGRIALALAARGAHVTGIDASAAMLDRLHAKRSDEVVNGSTTPVETIHGDMVADLPDRTYRLVFIAYNTFFSVGDRDLQERLFVEVASRLSPGGHFVIEAAVPDPNRPTGGTVGVRSLDVDRVVLSVDIHDADSQCVEGQFVEITQTSGIRLRPWRIRYCTPTEIDAMAERAGLTLTARWETMGRQPYVQGESSSHVSIYARRSDP